MVRLVTAYNPPNTVVHGWLTINYQIDIGFIGGTTTLASFQRDFGITPSNKAAVSGNIVASLQAGCIFGALSVAFLTDKVGRRLGLIVSGAIATVASVIQTVSIGKLGVMYAGRVLAGLGVGAASTLVPLYVGETAPKDIRGKLCTWFKAACLSIYGINNTDSPLVTLYSFFQFLGLSVAYWVDYACSEGFSPQGHEQWRVPVALQILPACGLCLGMIPAKESPRWLARNGRHEEALHNLAYIRMDPDIGPQTTSEYDEIKSNIDALDEETQGIKLKQLLLPQYRVRLLIGVAIMVSQQLTGTTVFTYVSNTDIALRHLRSDCMLE